MVLVSYSACIYDLINWYIVCYYDYICINNNHMTSSQSDRPDRATCRGIKLRKAHVLCIKLITHTLQRISLAQERGRHAVNRPLLTVIQRTRMCQYHSRMLAMHMLSAHALSCINSRLLLATPLCFKSGNVSPRVVQIF